MMVDEFTNFQRNLLAQIAQSLGVNYAALTTDFTPHAVQGAVEKSTAVSASPCPDCGRKVQSETLSASGFIAVCGRRLFDLADLAHPSPCPAAAGLSIVSWHNEDDIDLEDPRVRGWVGGIDQTDPPWADYIDRALDEADRGRLECLKAHLVENGIKRGGFWHQREGIPKFSDESYLFLSMRAWGDLLAAIFGGHYCHYAWED